MTIHIAEQAVQRPNSYNFGEFELDLDDESLRREGQKLNINRRMFQVLSLLIERRGEIVGKEEFFEKVWDGNFVEDNNLTVTVTGLRKALGDNAKQAKFIENIPRKGYRFIAPVTVEDRTDIGESVSASTRSDTEFLEPANGHRPKAQVASIESEGSLTTGMRKLPAGILVVLLISVLAIVVFGYRAYWRADQTTSVRIDSIAVLPFISSESDSEYVADGLTDGITDDLSKISRMRVIDRSSTFRYKNKQVDPIQAGSELGVSAIITGQVEQVDSSIVIDVKMIDIANKTQIWQQQFRRRKIEVFSIQQDISQAILKIAVPKISSQDQGRLFHRQTDDPEAYDLYIKGRYYWNKRTNPDFVRSAALFRAAIDRDPTFAKAYVGLADAYSLGSFEHLGISHDEKIELARGAAKRALEIDDTLGEAYASLAINKCYIDWDFSGAESDYARAIELNPNDATAHHWYAEFLGMQGRFDESFREYDRAIMLDPLSLPIRTDMATNYYYARNYDAAIENLNKAKELEPDYWMTYEFLNWTLREKGMFKEAAEAEAKRFVIQYKRSEIPEEHFATMKNYAESLNAGAERAGYEGYWQAELKFQLSTGQSFFTAVAYAKLGDADNSFAFLEKAFNAHYSGMVWLKVIPELDGLRSDPRYADLMRRVGF